VSYFDNKFWAYRYKIHICKQHIEHIFCSVQKLTTLHLLAEAKWQLCNHPSWQQYGGQGDELYPWCHSPKALQQPFDVPVALPQPKE
jgi:hypothetical protein